MGGWELLHANSQTECTACSAPKSIQPNFFFCASGVGSPPEGLVWQGWHRARALPSIGIRHPHIIQKQKTNGALLILDYKLHLIGCGPNGKLAGGAKPEPTGKHVSQAIVPPTLSAMTPTLCCRITTLMSRITTLVPLKTRIRCNAG